MGRELRRRVFCSRLKPAQRRNRQRAKFELADESRQSDSPFPTGTAQNYASQYVGRVVQSQVNP